MAGPIGADGGRARSQVGQAQADEEADEDALLLVLEEVRQRPPRLDVRKREGRRQIVDDGAPDALGLEAGEEESHDRGVLVVVGWWGSGPARGLSPPGPVRLLVDRGSSGKGAPQVRGYRRGEVAGCN